MDSGLFWIGLFFVVQVIHFFGTWKLYDLAGEKPWKAAIPVYNAVTLLKINKRPFWWVFVLFIPIVAPIMFIVFWIDTAASFGKRRLIDKILVVLTLGFYLYYLNYVEKPSYEPRDKSEKENFIGSTVFAVVIATVIHTFVVQPYTIPTGSMEKTLHVGDFIFVSKLNYGARVPITPIGIPFLQNAIPGTNRTVKSYVDKVRLPYMRFPKFESPEKNDIVVFNFPVDSINTAIDRKDPYVKRLVGMPGETLEVKNGELFINGSSHQASLPKSASKAYSYKVFVSEPFNEQMLKEEFGFLEHQVIGRENDSLLYLFFVSEKEAEDLKQYGNVIAVERNIFEKGVKDERFKSGTKIDTLNTIFPVNKNWNKDWYGPLEIPKKGKEIKLTQQNYLTYLDVIEKYEGHELSIKEGQFYIDGKPSNNYTPSQDYYFMMGDSRDNSLDSRYFGFVPDDHILGKPLFRWLSLEWRDGISIRKDETMTLVNSKKEKPTSYWWLGLGLVVAFFGFEFFKGKKKK